MQASTTRVDRSKRAKIHELIPVGAGASFTCRPLAVLQRFIHDHRAEPLPQRRVAEVAGVSTAAFSRFFKTRFNRTYRGYINEMRVADACRLLADSDRSVVDIALACGFANLSNFIRRFRQVKGVTPREYRRVARGG